MLNVLKSKPELHSAELALVLYLFHGNISAGVSWVILGLTGRELNLLGTPLVAVTMLCAAIALLHHFRRLKLDSLVLIIIFGFLYMVACLNPDSAYQVSRQNLVQVTLLDCIPAYILFRMCRHYDAIWKYAKVTSYVVLFVYAAAFVVYDVGHVYRSFSAGMALPALLFVVEWLYLEKNRTAPFAVLAIALLVVGGRRSSLIAVIILICIILFLKRDFVLLAAVALVGGALYLSFDMVVEQLYYFSSDFGINSRTLRRLMSGEAMEDSHRIDQWAYVLQLILRSPQSALAGLGIAGERSYMLAHFAHMQLQGYPHGLLVELIGHYGIVLGLALDVLLIAVGPYRVFRVINNDRVAMTVVLLFVALVSQLLFQDSYLQNKFFFVYLAILVNFAVGRRGEEATMFDPTFSVGRRTLS
ncbi:O-antigen ligase family protein [Paratractidigestivibacter sp.]|uniref:O-antigen ligase family protein n=1 Tax=Paratractidigestivibacter sp. TaxID=2847316 RepID=UPI002AC8D537|nr:O-antigen ligase family protein [Paratractidigestivibacter sp.]